jgi:SHS2 domain-containing protein
MVPESPKKFEIIEHTADIGIEATGRDLAELFENAAAGMFEIMADTGSLAPGESVKVEVAPGAPAADELLVAWLEELIFISETRALLFQYAEVERAGDGRVSGTVFGESLDVNRGAVRDEVKAVTYHQLRVEELPEGGWTCRVIFDI